jgi:hypothetical protein
VEYLAVVAAQSSISFSYKPLTVELLETRVAESLVALHNVYANEPHVWQWLT